MLLILIGILLNERTAANMRADMKDIRTYMKDMRRELHQELDHVRSELVSRIDRIDSDLANFYKVTGVLEGLVDELSKC